MNLPTITIRTAAWLAGLYLLLVIGVTTTTLLHGGTVAACSTPVTGEVLTQTHVECLRDRVRNEFNSQIDDANVAIDAAIAGSKTDQTFSRLISTGPLVVAAPTLTVGQLGSTIKVTATAPFGVSTLYSSGPITVSASALYSSGPITIGASGLISTQLFSIGGAAGVATTMLLLQSNASTATPVRNTLYANTVPKAMAFIGGDITPPTTLGSFNVNYASRTTTGLFSIFLLTSMGDTNYLVVGNVHTTDNGQVVFFNRGLWSFSVRVSDGAGNPVDRSFSLMVWGVQ